MRRPAPGGLRLPGQRDRGREAPARGAAPDGTFPGWARRRAGGAARSRPAGRRPRFGSRPVASRTDGRDHPTGRPGSEGAGTGSRGSHRVAGPMAGSGGAEGACPRPGGRPPAPVPAAHRTRAWLWGPGWPAPSQPVEAGSLAPPAKRIGRAGCVAAEDGRPSRPPRDCLPAAHGQRQPRTGPLVRSLRPGPQERREMPRAPGRTPPARGTRAFGGESRLRGTGVLAAGRRGRDRRGRVAAGLWWAADGAAHRASRARWETRRAREEAGPLGPSPGSPRSGAPCAGRRQAAGWRGVRLNRLARARRSSAGQGGGPAEPIGAFPARGRGCIRRELSAAGHRGACGGVESAGPTGPVAAGARCRIVGVWPQRAGNGAAPGALGARGAGDRCAGAGVWGRSFPSALSVCPLCRPARLGRTAAIGSGSGGSARLRSGAELRRRRVCMAGHTAVSGARRGGRGCRDRDWCRGPIALGGWSGDAGRLGRHCHRHSAEMLVAGRGGWREKWSVVVGIVRSRWSAGQEVRAEVRIPPAGESGAEGEAVAGRSDGPGRVVDGTASGAAGRHGRPRRAGQRPSGEAPRRLPEAGYPVAGASARPPGGLSRCRAGSCAGRRRRAWPRSTDGASGRGACGRPGGPRGAGGCAERDSQAFPPVARGPRRPSGTAAAPSAGGATALPPVPACATSSPVRSAAPAALRGAGRPRAAADRDRRAARRTPRRPALAPPPGRRTQPRRARAQPAPRPRRRNLPKPGRGRADARKRRTPHPTARNRPTLMSGSDVQAAPVAKRIWVQTAVSSTSVHSRRRPRGPISAWVRPRTWT